MSSLAVGADDATNPFLETVELLELVAASARTSGMPPTCYSARAARPGRNVVHERRATEMGGRGVKPAIACRTIEPRNNGAAFFPPPLP